MPKTFITERDIEDMARSGTMELAVDDNTVLTDLAYERANRLGIKLNQKNSQPPAAPIRPYLSQPVVPFQLQTDARSFNEPTVARMDVDLKRRVVEAVKARLGNQVDAAMITTIVERVFYDLGIH